LNNLKVINGRPSDISIFVPIKAQSASSVSANSTRGNHTARLSFWERDQLLRNLLLDLLDDPSLEE